MPPVGAALAAAVTAVVSTVGGIFSAVSAFTIGGFAVGRVLLELGLSFAANALLAPKRANVGARQASVLELSLGEGPREAVFGRDATGGSLANAWNDGASNEYETLVIVLADHECDALEAFYVNDTKYTFTANGAQSHAGLSDGGNPVLWLEFRRGALSDTTPSYVSSEGVAAGEWTSGELAGGFLRGICYVVARYKVSDKVWKSGRPAFKWLLRGLRCYDPRKDSTVSGGSGAHRWGQPSTYEWTDNAAVCRANFMWGVWNYAADPPQLMVGPGKSFDEEPAEYVIADANLCDENVTLKAGGTEKRYRVGAVVRADEAWIEVEENFAAATGGQLVERSGSIGVDPGAAKTPVATFTDDDLIVGKEVRYQAKLSRDEMCNTVAARYADPDQLYEETSAPLRRSLDDINTDGQPYEETLDLVFVRSGTQAQRIAEIHRRKKRLQAVAAVTLGPRFMLLEDGDWVTWQSERRFGGDAVTFEVQGVAVDQAGFTTLALKQINSSVFAWNAASDQLDPQNPIYLPPGALPDAELNGVAVEPTTRTEGSQQIPLIRVTWTPPGDASIKSVLVQWRKQGSSLVSSNTTADVVAGEFVIDSGLIGLSVYEVRVTPLTTPQRGEISSAWLEVTTAESSGGQALNFTAVASANMVIFGRSLRKVVGAAAIALEWDDASSLEWDDASPLEWDSGDGWNGHVYSAESYAGGASVLAILTATDKQLAIGLSQLPSPVEHYEGIDFSWVLGADGKWRVYESGLLLWDNDGDPPTAAVNDIPEVTYDGSYANYYISGALKYQSPSSPNLRLYFDSSFYGEGARLDGVSFTASATGQVQETRWKRSVAPPATPTDVEPADWALAPPTGSEALWSVTAKKSLSGAFVTGWSTPVLMSSPNWRGAYSEGATYYREDAVTYHGGSYRCTVDSVIGRAPTGTGQENAWWALISQAGGEAPPPTPPSEYTATIAAPSSTTGVNLYELAIADGYTGHGDTNIAFEVNSGVSVTGIAGAPDGGAAILTGVWPDGYTHTLTLTCKSGSVVRGGGGKGGKGGDNISGPQYGGDGGRGGDAVYCQADITITIDSGAIVQGGGGGGPGGNGRISGYTKRGGGGGGGGVPNGPGGAGGDGGFTDGNPGVDATLSAPGAGGTAPNGHVGWYGADYGETAYGPDNSGNPGAGGFCIKKNGFAVSVTNNGTTAGAIG